MENHDINKKKQFIAIILLDILIYSVLNLLSFPLVKIVNYRLCHMDCDFCSRERWRCWCLNEMTAYHTIQMWHWNRYNINANHILSELMMKIAKHKKAKDIHTHTRLHEISNIKIINSPVFEIYIGIAHFFSVFHFIEFIWMKKKIQNNKHNIGNVCMCVSALTCFCVNSSHFFRHSAWSLFHNAISKRKKMFISLMKYTRSTIHRRKYIKKRDREGEWVSVSAFVFVCLESHFHGTHTSLFFFFFCIEIILPNRKVSH